MAVENRTKLDFTVSEIPTPRALWTPDFVTQKCACEPFLVCGEQSAELHRRDYTSAWAKLYNAGDSVEFTVYKDDVLLPFTPLQRDFPNDLYSKYITIDWSFMLNTYGTGCYRIELAITIAGLITEKSWGEYALIEYSDFAVRNSVKISSVFNSNQTIEKINFSGANVVDDIRFNGSFGDLQPKTVIENEIRSNYVVEKIMRENINVYELRTSLINYEIILKLLKLHLLSQNTCFITDYNPESTSGDYVHKEFILSETPEVTYFKGSRKAKLTASFGDKKQIDRSYY